MGFQFFFSDKFVCIKLLCYQKCRYSRQTSEKMVKNLENKENTSQLDPSKAWIRNIGTGSTRRSPKKWINRNRSVSEAKPMAPTTQTQQCKVRQRLAEFYQSRANERTQTAQQNSTVIELDDSDPKPSVNASQSLFVEESVTVDETVEYESTSTAQNKSKQNLTAQQNGTVIVLDDSDPKPGLNMSQSLFVEETVIVDETIDVSESTIVKAKMGTIAEASNDQTMNKTVVVRTEPTKPAKALPFFEVSTDISSIFEPSSSSSAESTVMPLSSTFASTTCIRMQNVATELRKLQISNGKCSFFDSK